MIYFDNAATSGAKPQSVVNAVNNAILNYSANPGRSGHNASVKASEAVYNVREKIARFFNATGADRVVFTYNCTHSINCVLKGVLNYGDHAIVSSLEHNAVMRPLKKTKVSFDTFAVSFNDEEKTLKNLIEKIKPNTKLVFCTAASNVFGKILPLKRIGEICKQKGILFGVDAAQLAGIQHIDVKLMNIDYLCIAPHKGLFAPMGVGVLICEKPINKTLIEGGTGTNSAELVQPESLPERLESGTLGLPAIMGLGAGVDFIKKIGIKEISEHEMRLTQKLYNGLQKNKNILLYTPYPDLSGYAPVISFNFKDAESFKTASYLNENGIAVRGGLHCAPMAHKQIGTLNTGTVRVSLGYFNTLREVNEFLSVINNEKILKKLKKAIE